MKYEKYIIIGIFIVCAAAMSTCGWVISHEDHSASTIIPNDTCKVIKHRHSEVITINYDSIIKTIPPTIIYKNNWTVVEKELTSADSIAIHEAVLATKYLTIVKDSLDTLGVVIRSEMALIGVLHTHKVGATFKEVHIKEVIHDIDSTDTRLVITEHLPIKPTFKDKAKSFFKIAKVFTIGAITGVAATIVTIIYFSK